MPKTLGINIIVAGGLARDRQNKHLPISIRGHEMLHLSVYSFKGIRTHGHALL